MRAAPNSPSAKRPASFRTKRSIDIPGLRRLYQGCEKGGQAIAASLKQSQRLEAGMTASTDHQMVVDRYFQGSRGGGYFACHFDIGAAGSGVATGMVVHQNHRHRAQLERPLDDLARID